MARSRRTFAVAWTLLAAALAGAPARLAGAEEPQASSLSAAKAADVARRAAKRLWASVEDARRQQLPAFAALEARLVVEQDPDHAGARGLLGWVRRDGEWRLDEAAAAKVPRENPLGKLSREDAAKVERRWWRDVRPVGRSAAAGIWAAFGDECAAAGDADGARAAWQSAVAIDPDDERARKGLGFYRWQRLWLTEAQYRTVLASQKTEVVEQESPVEKVLGGRFVKLRTAHFQVEGRLPEARLGAIAKALETAYAVHLIELGRDPSANAFSRPVRMVLCESERDWDLWIERFVQTDRDFKRTLEGTWADAAQYAMRRPDDDSDERRTDHLVHRAVHAVTAGVLRIHWPSWADEGLAHLTTIRIQSGTRTWCVGLTTSDYARLDAARGVPDGWIDEAEWKGVTRATVLARDDLALRTVVGKPVTETGVLGVTKAWSLLDCWRETDPEGLRALLGKLGGAKDPAAVIEAHFGRGLEALDEEWRRWVLRSY